MVFRGYWWIFKDISPNFVDRLVYTIGQSSGQIGQMLKVCSVLGITRFVRLSGQIRGQNGQTHKKVSRSVYPLVWLRFAYATGQNGQIGQISEYFI